MDIYEAAQRGEAGRLGRVKDDIAHDLRSALAPFVVHATAENLRHHDSAHVSIVVSVGDLRRARTILG